MAETKKNNGKKNTVKKTPVKDTNKETPENLEKEAIWKRDITFLIIFGVAVLLMLSNFGICGVIGRGLKFFFFCLFGAAAYAFPFVLFAGAVYYVINRKKKRLKRTYIGLCGLFLLACALLQMISVDDPAGMKISDIFTYGPLYNYGGGFFGGIIAKALAGGLGRAGAYVVIIIGIVIFAIILTQRPLVSEAKKKGTEVYKDARQKVKEAKERREEIRKANAEAVQKPVLDFEDLDEEDNGQYAFNVRHEITSTEAKSGPGPVVTNITASPERKKTSRPAASLEIPPFLKGYGLKPFDNQKEETPAPAMPAEAEVRPAAEKRQAPAEEPVTEPVNHSEASETPAVRKGAARPRSSQEEIAEGIEEVSKEIAGEAVKAAPVYQLPPLSLLNAGGGVNQNLMNAQVQETADKLQKTLDSFGVAAKVTGFSCGPTVTRYELAPEQGVKVSRIISLADDIKLNLATADIRIEAPIPGKAAVGIEVPNQTNASVALSDLLRSDEFRNFKSKLAFAVGVDLAGKIVVTDIAKMPHLLIAGATGSGKSVCINTLILSLLYKATPDEVKFLMIDPKVVELQIFNDIPHLLIPVVTDPKKAAGALNWAVTEMSRRYNLFAEFNVKDLSSYNTKAKSLQGLAGEGEKDPEILPQIVIIIDELADLMMTSPQEVEDAICRLAQLARAAGLHLVIATQRPSVNVITGLIKANMPSRIALSVTSGTDSRVIIDMVGAEKLLGKGDMLFYPQGYAKPARVQGAFISDDEIAKVVDFLKSQRPEDSVSYDAKIQFSVDNSSSADGGSAAADDRDPYFFDAGKFIIEKDKASIGMLQRMFKIGFNRAARIMDQLCEAGVVGEEEGTKPRRILMTAAEFEEYTKENK